MRDTYTFHDLQNWEGVSAGVEPPVRLGIFGDPVEHSRSPEMQNAALAACGLPMRYARFRIASDELEPALRLLPSLGFIGVNLTIPHKIAAMALMAELDPFAGRVGAVNTVRVDGNKLVGHNTDGPGFAAAVRSEFSVDLRDLRVLLLGAGGGAGRAIAMQCAITGCERLVLVNRTLEKAQQLAAELGPRVEAVPWDEHALAPEIAQTDLVVNATSIGMRASDPPVLAGSLLAPHLLVYDTVYGGGESALLTAAAAAGARTANGFSMLLHQGALAFEKWFHRNPPLAEMQAAVMAAQD